MSNLHDPMPGPGSQLPVQHGDNNQSLALYDGSLNHQAFDDDEIDLRALWKIVLRYRKLIGVIFSVVVLTAAIITLLLRPMYTSTISLEINTSGRSLVKFQNLENQEVGNREYMATQSKILGSSAVAIEVIKRLKLLEEPEFNGETNQRGLVNGIRSILSLFSSKDVAEEDLIKAATKRYQERLKVSPVRNTSIVNVSFEAFDSALAAKIANEHAKAYVQLSDDRRFNSTSGAKAFLEKEISNVQARLETSEKQLNSFARKFGVVDLEDRNNIMIARLSKLNESLSLVQNERIDAETRYIQAKSSNTQNLVAVYDDVLIKSLREEQSSVQAEYFELAKIYKPKYPLMLQLKAKIEEIEVSIQSQAAKIVGGLETSYGQLKLREEKLNEELDRLKSGMLDLQDRAVTYNILKREWEANKELYSGLLERTKEVGVAAGMELNVGSVIDEARQPDDASSPKFALNLMIAAFLGLACGLGAAFLLAMLDNTINDPEQLQQVTQIGMLGMAPEMDVNEDFDTTTNMKMMDTMMHIDPGSAFAESIQSVRTSLSYAQAGGFPKSIMVTSSMAGEGKSTVALNLAISCAKSGKRVLVIEADLRRSRHYKVFGVPAAPGLSDCLVGTPSIEPHVVQQIPNLSLFVSGSKTPNPVDLLGSQKMRDLIKGFEETHDLIVVDCPPVLGLADSIIMSRMVESVLFVVSAHNTPKDAVKSSIQRLRMVGAPLIGAVLNKVNSQHSGYSYDYYTYNDALQNEAQEAIQ